MTNQPSAASGNTASGKRAQALGYFTMGWAALETSADFLISVIFHKADGRKIQPELPRSLSRKIEFLDQSYKKLDELRPHRDTGLKIVESIKKFRDDRHFLIHGVGVTAIPGGEKIRKLVYTPTLLKIEVREISDEFIVDLIRQAATITNDILTHVEMLMRLFIGEDEVNKALGDGRE